MAPRRETARRRLGLDWPVTTDATTQQPRLLGRDEEATTVVLAEQR